jgi:hypothetical protein
MNTNLLKEAIAEADAIKKMAIENAKASLNEAFDSKVKAMLAARLSEEADDLEEEYDEESDEKKMNEKKHDEKEMNGDDEGYGMEEAEEEMPSEDEAYGKEEEEADEAFNLDAILAELEKGGDEEVMEGEDEDDEAPKEEPEEDDMDEAKDEEEGDEDMKEAKDEEKEESVDEEIDIAALLAEMEDDDEKMEEAKDEDEDEKDKDEVAVLEEEMMSLLEKMKMAKKAKEEKKEKMMEKKDPKEEELQEIKRQAAELAQKVNETNLINAKLLYLNKILRKYNLSEQQKLKVISAFDKASTTKEAKIVHESLDQAFSVKNDNTKVGLKESMGFASKAAGTSTKRVINEGVITDADAQVSRWQKLAGIIK